MKNRTISPRTKDILHLLGTGVLLSAIFLAPGVAVGIGAILKEYEKMKREKDWDEWQKFNIPRLRHMLKRFARQKLITVGEEPSGMSVVRLTEKGKLRTLKYRLEDMDIEKPPKWDGEWRVIIYDIAKFKKREQTMFRSMLKKLNMLRLQKSVYLYPYPCKNELDFLRAYLDVDEAVIYLTVCGIENEDVYKHYFGLL